MERAQYSSLFPGPAGGGECWSRSRRWTMETGEPAGRDNRVASWKKETIYRTSGDPTWYDGLLEESESDGASMLTSGGIKTSGMGCDAWWDYKKK